MGGYSKRIAGKSTIKEGKIVMQIAVFASALIKVPRDKVLSLFLVLPREIHLQMEVSPTNGNVFYKG